jgi:hypothetical protein
MSIQTIVLGGVDAGKITLLRIPRFITMHQPPELIFAWMV